MDLFYYWYIYWKINIYVIGPIPNQTDHWSKAVVHGNELFVGQHQWLAYTNKVLQKNTPAKEHFPQPWLLQGSVTETPLSHPFIPDQCRRRSSLETAQWSLKSRVIETAQWSLMSSHRDGQIHPLGFCSIWTHGLNLIIIFLSKAWTCYVFVMQLVECIATSRQCGVSAWPAFPSGSEKGIPSDLHWIH